MASLLCIREGRHVFPSISQPPYPLNRREATPAPKVELAAGAKEERFQKPFPGRSVAVRRLAFENVPPEHRRTDSTEPWNDEDRCPIRSGMTESDWPKGRRKPVAAAVQARVRKRKCAGASAGGGDAKRHDEHCPPTLRAARLVKGEVGSSSPRCRSVSALSSLHCSSNSRLPECRRTELRST